MTGSLSDWITVRARKTLDGLDVIRTESKRLNYLEAVFRDMVRQGAEDAARAAFQEARQANSTQGGMIGAIVAECIQKPEGRNDR